MSDVAESCALGDVARRSSAARLADVGLTTTRRPHLVTRSIRSQADGFRQANHRLSMATIRRSLVFAPATLIVT